MSAPPPHPAGTRPDRIPSAGAALGRRRTHSIPPAPSPFGRASRMHPTAPDRPAKRRPHAPTQMSGSPPSDGPAGSLHPPPCTIVRSHPYPLYIRKRFSLAIGGNYVLPTQPPAYWPLPPGPIPYSGDHTLDLPRKRPRLPPPRLPKCPQAQSIFLDVS